MKKELVYSKVLFCKSLIFILFVGCFKVHGQSASIFQPVYDADSLLLFVVKDSNSFQYVTLKGEVVDASYDNISYIGGKKGLEHFMDSLYFDDFYRHNEVNIPFYFYLLFDQNLKIKEIRFLGQASKHSMHNFEPMIKDILKRSEGNWIISYLTDKKWYIYLGRYKLW